MQNTTRLLERHVDQLARRRALIVDADDNALGALADDLRLHADRVDIRADQHAAMPELPADCGLLILILPKSRERLDWLLKGLAAQLDRPLDCWLVGPGKGGIRGALSSFSAAVEDVQQLDSARHCKLFAGQLRPAVGEAGVSGLTRWQWQGLTVCSLPGVFAHGRLDDGSDLLLDVLQALDVRQLSGTGLDLGCGSGILTAMLARAGCQVTATDVSATAVAATRATLEANGLDARVLHSDLYAAVDGERFDLICSNPPFHAGIEQTTAISRALIGEAPDHLRAAGQLILVANQGLPYGDWLREAFSRVEVLKETRRFRVWRAAL